MKYIIVGLWVFQLLGLGIFLKFQLIRLWWWWTAYMADWLGFDL